MAVAGALYAADLQVMSGGGARAVLERLSPQFQTTTGNKVELQFAVVGAIQQRLAKGGKADVVLLPVALIEAMDKTGAFRTQARAIIGRIPVGVVVHEGAQAPDISNPEAVRKVLLDARSVVFPDPKETPTGKHLMGAFTQMGIAQSMQPKITFKNAIDGGVDLVRDGKIDLGLVLVTEILPVKGVRLVGSLPTSMQGCVVYAAAVAVDTKAPQAAAQFIKFISQSNVGSEWKAAGFEPTAGN